jgi:homogentisate 1,2-dioxygenase
MPSYRRVGEVPRKRHTVAMAGEGRRLEELMGQDGFSEESALLYHRHSPSALTSIEAVRLLAGSAVVPPSRPDLGGGRGR